MVNTKRWRYGTTTNNKMILNIYNLNYKMDEQLIQDIKSGKYKKIVIFSGAGVSLASGIPVYRGPDGLYAKLTKRLREENVKDSNGNYVTAEYYFTETYVKAHPECRMHPLILEAREQLIKAEPTYAHKLAKFLYDKGWLKRVYTQNIDGLYQKAGLPDEKVIEVHGSYRNGNLVLFGGQLDRGYIEKAMIEDKIDEDIDLGIVMGTSLAVSPFCWFPNILPPTCHRVAINKDPFDYNDSFLYLSGDYDSDIKDNLYYLIDKKMTMCNLWSDRYDYYNKQTLLFNRDLQEISKDIIE